MIKSDKSKNDVRAALLIKASLEAAQEIRKRYIAEFAVAVTSGTSAVPFGLPIKPTDLQVWMSTLDSEQLKFAQSMLREVQKFGRVQFSKNKVQGAVELDTKTKQHLSQWIAAGNKAERFFAENADILGDAAQYDLSEFEV